MPVSVGQEPVYDLALTEFFKLKLKYGWGPSLPYYLAAEYNIHPTLVQKLLSDYPITNVLNAVFMLKDKISLRQKELEEGING